MIKGRLPRHFLSLLVIPGLLVSAWLGTTQKTWANTPGEQASLGNDGNLTHPSIQVVETTPEGLILEFTPTRPEIEEILLNGLACQAISIPGMAQSDSPGAPSLPVQGAMLGIPQDAQPSINILTAEWTALPGSYDLCPVPQPDLARSPRSPWQFVGTTSQRGPSYQVDAFAPANAAELISTGSLRSQRYAQVRFNPLQYNPVTGELRLYKRIRLEVRFNASTGTITASPGQALSEGFFEESLRSLLVNYDQARAWRTAPQAIRQPAAQTQGINSPLSSPAYKLPVDQDGLYQVSYSDLEDAGLPVDTLDPRTFQLFNQSVEAAIYVEGESDGIFNATDYLLFFGQKVNTRYTETNVYWLTFGSANGLRMASLDGTPSGTATVPADFLTTQHIECDTDYYSDEPSGPANDHWYWDYIYASSGSASIDFTFDLAHLGAGSHSINIRGLIEGYSASPNHHTRVYLNNNLIDDHSFPTNSEYTFNVSHPQSFLVEGTNTLTVECPRDGAITLDYVLINWFEIDYYDTYFAENDRLFFDGEVSGSSLASTQAVNKEFQVDGFSSNLVEVYDVTDPLAPVLITGSSFQPTANGQQLAFEAALSNDHRYLAQTTTQRLSLNPLDIILDTPSSWKSASIGADYIILSHASFLSQVQPLAVYRANQGLRVQVVDVQDVYDEFNGGVFSAEAIKSFIDYAYHNWTAPAPSFVLLVGDGHFDFKNVYNWNEPNYIPPYLDDVDPWTGETPTDNRFVSVSGGDILPDLNIGRFPVRTPAEAQTMVEKTINYEQNPPVGGWNALLSFVADNTDSGGNFAAQADGLINTYVAPPYTADKIYFGLNYTDAGLARTALKTAINQGRLFVDYTGHGSTQQWASENLLNLTDLASLTNGVKLPFMLPMTCGEGYFVWPNPSGSDYSALGESIVRINGKGAIASWSPSGYGLNSGHKLLNSSLFDELFNHHQNRIGFLTTNAKYYLFANSSTYNDLIETFVLFGDPALRLQALPVPAPADPSNLQATAVSSTQVDLSWQDNSSDESEFRIERSPDGSTGWQQIATVGASVTSYRDTGRSCNTTYHYRLRAYREADGKISGYSNTDSAATYACRTLSFYPGWNLITLPLTPVNPYNAETLLQGINAQGGACTEIDEWLNGGWNSHLLGFTFNQFPVVMGDGYFVRCSQSSTWVQEGSLLANGVVVNLVPGWNLVGFPYPEQGYKAEGILDAVNAQGGNCSEIDHWVNGGWLSHLLGFTFNDFDILPTEGYFIRCSASSSFVP